MIFMEICTRKKIIPVSSRFMHQNAKNRCQFMKILQYIFLYMNEIKMVSRIWWIWILIIFHVKKLLGKCLFNVLIKPVKLRYYWKIYRIWIVKLRFENWRLNIEMAELSFPLICLSVELELSEFYKHCNSKANCSIQ